MSNFSDITSEESDENEDKLLELLNGLNGIEKCFIPNHDISDDLPDKISKHIETDNSIKFGINKGLNVDLNNFKVCERTSSPNKCNDKYKNDIPNDEFTNFSKAVITNEINKFYKNEGLTASSVLNKLPDNKSREDAVSCKNVIYKSQLWNAPEKLDDLVADQVPAESKLNYVISDSESPTNNESLEETLILKELTRIRRALFKRKKKKKRKRDQKRKELKSKSAELSISKHENDSIKLTESKIHRTVASCIKRVEKNTIKSSSRKSYERSKSRDTDFERSKSRDIDFKRSRSRSIDFDCSKKYGLQDEKLETRYPKNKRNSSDCTFEITSSKSQRGLSPEGLDRERLRIENEEAMKSLIELNKVYQNKSVDVYVNNQSWIQSKNQYFHTTTNIVKLNENNYHPKIESTCMPSNYISQVNLHINNTYSYDYYMRPPH